jgi:hypothetical protein
MSSKDRSAPDAMMIFSLCEVAGEGPGAGEVAVEIESESEVTGAGTGADTGESTVEGAGTVEDAGEGADAVAGEVAGEVAVKGSADLDQDPAPHDEDCRLVRVCRFAGAGLLGACHTDVHDCGEGNGRVHCGLDAVE